VFARFGPEKNMQIYGRGIRRRLAPMLGDARRIRLANSLLFSLPGAQVIRYGDEIGMGDDLSLPERESVRTVMQWSKERNGGFSTAPAERLARPTIADGPFGYRDGVNVESQHRDASSLLHWMERLIHTRKQCPELGWGSCAILDAGDPAVFAHRCDWSGGTVVAVHNLADRPAAVRLALDGVETMPMIELMGDQPYQEIRTGQEIDLEPYGYRWFRIGGARRFLL
ncbi:MAG TPA: alpha-glucosidase C-terminal domain-containing protein, partial [Thermoanaerobaculia bacterium]